MPRRVFDYLPEEITTGDFVKINDLFSYLHWDKTVYLYHCPYTKRYALISSEMSEFCKLNARAISKGDKILANVTWYKTAKQLVAEHQAFLMERTVNGVVYYKLKYEGIVTKVR